MGQGTDARRPVGQQMAYLRTRRLGSSGVGKFLIGKVPAGSNIVRIGTAKRVAFDGAGTTLQIGNSFGTTNNIVAAATNLVTPAATHQAATFAAGVTGLVDVDTELWGEIAAGPPTAGVLDVMVEFIPPDEAA